MTDYTPSEVWNAIEEAEEHHDLGYGDSTFTVMLRDEEVTIAVQSDASKPPAEGGGEDIYVVFKAGDQFFKKTGYYYSYDGSNWDGQCTEVRPVQKFVTIYE